MTTITQARLALANPDRVAYYEAAGWRAYYDHAWLKAFRLLVNLNQEQFRIPFPYSIIAAYYVVRASILWVPVDHDEARVQAYLTRFYALASRHSGRAFDPVEAGRLEVIYWRLHRDYSGKTDKPGYVECVADLHGHIFGIGDAAARESAEWRVKAADTVDLITSKTSTDVEGDWTRLEVYLRECYRIVAGA